MICPACGSNKVTFPTRKVPGSSNAQMKSGPASCPDCGAHEERTTQDGKNWKSKWVKGGS